MTFLSLKGMLTFGLSQLLFSNREENTVHFTAFSHNRWQETLTWAEIPMYKKISAAEVLYSSAILLRIINSESTLSTNANVKNGDSTLTLSDISKQIVSELRNGKSKLINNQKKHNCCEPDHNNVDIFLISKLWDEFEIETHPTGWMSFCFSDAGVQTWLTHLNGQLSIFMSRLSCQMHTPPSEPLLGDLRVWQMQYMHGRCCALLRQWNAQVSPDYQVKNDTSFQRGGVERGDRNSIQQASAASTTAHRQVVHALVTLIDLAECDLFWIPYRWPSEQYFLLLKAGCQLCRSFEQFLSMDLSGFGAISDASAAIAKRNFQARFLLTLVVQKTLRVIMERCLGIIAPKQL